MTQTNGQTNPHRPAGRRRRTRKCNHVTFLSLYIDYIVLYCIVSYRIVSYRVVSCRVVSCRVVSCRVVSCRVVSCRVVSCRIVSYRIVLYCTKTGVRQGCILFHCVILITIDFVMTKAIDDASFGIESAQKR